MATHHDLEDQQHNPMLSLDYLYCEEEVGEDGLEGESRKPSLLPLLLLEHDLFWEDEELLSIFSKEQQSHPNFDIVETKQCLLEGREGGVKWMLRVNAHYGFTSLTAILAVNYFDRFLTNFHFQKDKPWTIQLAAVACLSLAAKFEETQVPFLLDFQVEETEYVFEAKTIQRMELLVLSTLQWRMNPVTPLSFLEHIVRRLGLKTQLHWEFLRRCENLLLSLVADSRSVYYLPSMLATATMLHVIHQVEPYNPIQYQNQLLGALGISKEKVNDCYQLIGNLSNTSFYGPSKAHKRKYCRVPRSPSGVVDSCFSSDSLNDAWAVVGPLVSSSAAPMLKRSRAEGQQMHLPLFVDVVGSPP